MANSIKKVTLKNRSLKVDFVEYIKNAKGEERENTTSTTYGHLVHNDLTEAIESLKPHLAMLCEQTEAPLLRTGFDQMPPESIKKIVEKYSISSFTVGKNGEGVSIGGGKALSNSKFLELDSPHQEYDSSYDWSPELSMTLDVVLQEVQLYMDGKEAEPVQGDLFNPKGDDNEDME
jgi:hypothetical protein